MRHAYNTRSGLYRYLLELGVRDGMRLGFVDIGWSGTTQDAFEAAIKSMFDVEVIGYYFCLADTPSRRARGERLQMKALLDASFCDPAWLAEIYNNRVPVEMFFSAPEGATVGYDGGATMANAPPARLRSSKTNAAALTTISSKSWRASTRVRWLAIARPAPCWRRWSWRSAPKSWRVCLLRSF